MIGARVSYVRSTKALGIFVFSGVVLIWSQIAVATDHKCLSGLSGTSGHAARDTYETKYLLGNDSTLFSALGSALEQLPISDRSRVLRTPSEDQPDSLPQLFSETTRKLQEYSDLIASHNKHDQALVLYFGESQYHGHNGGVAIWRFDAYIQGYYHRRIQEGGSKPASELWMEIWNSQPSMLWDSSRQQYEIKRGEATQRHLFSEISKNAKNGKVEMFRGMSEFEAVLFELNVGLKKGLFKSNWRQLIENGLEVLEQDVRFHVDSSRRSGAEGLRANERRLEKFLQYKTRVLVTMSALKEQVQVARFLRVELQTAITQSRYGAYFLTPTKSYANKFAYGRIARFQISASELQQMLGARRIYFGMENAPEMGIATTGDSASIEGVTDLLLESFQLFEQPVYDY